jgi:hypothetical protein
LECVNKRKVTLRLKENLFRDIPLNMYRREDLSVSKKLSFIVYIVVSLTGNLAYAVCSKSSICSDKLHILPDTMIKEVHKILIFSQSPGMLVLIQVYLSYPCICIIPLHMCFPLRIVAWKTHGKLRIVATMKKFIPLHLYNLLGLERSQKKRVTHGKLCNSAVKKNSSPQDEQGTIPVGGVYESTKMNSAVPNTASRMLSSRLQVSSRVGSSLAAGRHHVSSRLQASFLSRVSPPGSRLRLARVPSGRRAAAAAPP